MGEQACRFLHLSLNPAGVLKMPTTAGEHVLATPHSCFGPESRGDFLAGEAGTI